MQLIISIKLVLLRLQPFYIDDDELLQRKNNVDSLISFTTTN